MAVVLSTPGDGYAPSHKDRWDTLRREGRCVTANHDLSNAGRPVVPADPFGPLGPAEIKEPKHESMPDG